jgi:dihydrofolate synthase/folylpolyglutamate synthase
MRALLRALHAPHRRYRSIIVAGTNGKGSTSATLAAILQAAGHRVGLYTSPHLVELRERWMIGGAMIDPALLDSSIEELQRVSEIPPTYFEALTMIAFIAFARAQCDTAVLEVGMGGRLDATNVVKPIAALITPIGFDHMEFLGNTIRKIAAEKAGVIHRGSLVLTTNDDPLVLSVLRRRAQTFGNRFIHVTEEHDTPLAGPFQRRNVALAVRAARELGIGEAAIEKGVRNTRWRGRLERICVGSKDVWIDGAHNAHAAAQIAPYLDANVPRPRLLVFGMMSDKHIEPVKELLFPLFDRVITTEPYPPRSAKASDLGGIPIPNPDDAFRAALASPERAIVVTGSLYLAGAAIAYFDREHGQQQHD